MQSLVAQSGISLQEIEESMYWIEVLLEANIISEHQLDILYDETDQLIAIFIAIIKRKRSDMREDSVDYLPNLDDIDHDL